MSMLRRAANLLRQLSAERSSPAAQDAMQLTKLRRLVHEAYNHTVAYRCLMQRAGVVPADITTLDHIRRLPVLKKRDLLEFTEAERTNESRVSRYGSSRIATSGSSGEPFEFLVDAIGNDWRKAQYLRPYVSNGRRPWHRVLRLTALNQSSHPEHVRLGVYREVRLPCTGPVEQQLGVLEALRPTILQGYPSALRCLASEIRRRGIRVSGVERIFSDSELLTPDTRSLIEKAFRAPLIDVFGTYETDNIAYQCIERRGYHCALDSGIVEVCRADAAISSGDGDLVVTVLNNLTTPFIRYNLEDVVSHRETACPCGRTFPLLDIVAGRRDDLVAAGNGEWQSPLSFLWRFDAFSEFIREYQVVQTDVDRFLVKVVPQGKLNDADEEAIRCAMLADYPNATVTVSAVSALPRGAAEKLKAFVSEVPAEGARAHGD